MKIRIRTGYVLIGVTYLATITAILAGCGAPFRKNWQIYPNPGSTSLLSRPYVTILAGRLIASRPLPACHLEDGYILYRGTECDYGHVPPFYPTTCKFPEALHSL